MSKEFRYHCRFKWEDQTRYGIIDQYSPEAKELAKKNGVLIACAVGPQCFSIPESDVTDLDDKDCGHWDEQADIFWGGGEVSDFIALCQLAANIREKQLEGEKLQVGHQFSIGVADGAAHYVVVKVMQKNCDLEWRGWCPDRYRDHHFGWGGRFPIADVQRYVTFGNGLGRLFGSKKRDDPETSFRRLKVDWEKRFGKLPESEFLAF